MSASTATAQRKSTARTGAAPRIRALKERYPEMSKAAIALLCQQEFPYLRELF